MRWIRKPLQFLYTLYALVIFIALMIPVFVWSMIASMFGKIRGGNLIYQGCILWADLWFALVFIRHINIYRGAEEKRRPYIFVSNHISYLDAAVIPKTFRFPIRPLGKIELAKVPVFGFIYRKAIVAVDRSSSKTRAKSVDELKEVLGHGISILVFPEGTFNESGQPLGEFFDGAFRIAIETNTPIKPVIFLDTYDRMHYRSIFTINPGKSRAVYLEAVDVNGLTLNDLKSLKERVKNLMEEELLKWKASWVKRL